MPVACYLVTYSDVIGVCAVLLCTGDGLSMGHPVYVFLHHILKGFDDVESHGCVHEAVKCSQIGLWFVCSTTFES